MDRKKLAEKLLEVEMANKRAMALTQRLAELQVEITHTKNTLANQKNNLRASGQNTG
ncbi:hypothetical protein [Rhizobium sp. AC27/96]|uniref:hypothetical protein n=1 Tax=Rhizobium sp. AC27/96 TaxID=1841653 RepID=UPI00130101C5|nr:hypothetical protein [Rhizobium sp. AC27/96]